MRAGSAEYPRARSEEPMYRMQSRVAALAATIVILPFAACAGSGDTSGGGAPGTGAGTTGPGASGTGGTNHTSTGPGTGGVPTTTSNTGAGAGTTSSGTGATGTTSTSSGTGATGTTSSGTTSTSPSNSGMMRACAADATVISDFEENAMVVETAFGGANGQWYSYADTVVTSTPTNTVETKTPSAMCDKYDLHATSTGHTMYTGVGVTLDSTNPADSMAKKLPVDLSKYVGVQFDIKSDGTNGPIFFEFLNTQNQPSPSGTATNQNVDQYNTHGVLLNSPTAANAAATPNSVPITTSWQTVTIPFGILGPRYLPSGTACTAGVKCEAPPFDPTTVLGFQFSVVNEFTGSTGGYNIAIDNFKVMTATDGTLGVAGYVPAYTQTAGAAHMFPQDAAVGSCTKPTGASGKYLIEAYNRWKQRFVVSAGNNLRVQRPENNNDTVSEGIGYGMLIAVNMNDKALFDGLWGYWQANATAGSLMTWQVPGGNGSATDADEDAAFALLLASKQWGGTYLNSAKTVIGNIWTSDIQSTGSGTIPIPNGGSSYSGSGSSLTNPSYFAPAYYKVFATVDTGHNWAGVITNVYTYLTNIMSHGSANGLIPAWCQNNCTTAGGTSNANNNAYQYDAHRVPWRIGLDACWNGNASAKSYVNTATNFWSGAVGTGAAGPGLGALADIYATGGTAVDTTHNSMSLIGTMGVGAMAAGNAALAQRAYQFIVDASYSPDPVGATAAYTYFNATVGLLTALTLSGNFMTYP
jgi:endo-1,4-beta-D-glucanase Y